MGNMPFNRETPVVGVRAPAVPGERRPRAWLDLPRLKADTKALEARLASLRKELPPHAVLPAPSDPDFGLARTLKYVRHGMIREALDTVEELTDLYALRALHRGKIHAGRRRLPSGKIIELYDDYLPRLRERLAKKGLVKRYARAT